MKPLDALKLKAIEMLAYGATEHQVASSCGKSRSWVQALKRCPEAQNKLRERLNVTQEIINNQTQAAITGDLEDFRNKLKQSSDLLYNATKAYLEKIKEKIDVLESDDISANRLGQNLKQGAECLTIALELGKNAVGLDEVLEMLNEVQEIGASSSKALD